METLSMYRFRKYGTLRWYNGIPVYVGGRLVTKTRLALWWPVNWVVLTIVVPYALFYGIREGVKAWKHNKTLGA